MTSSFGGGAVAAVVDHVARAGRGRAAAGACRRWARRRPELACFACPAEAAAACRAARAADQDRLLWALLAVSARDEWAQLTILAGLARRLAWVAAGWARAGVPAAEAADMEAELVAACWQAIADWGSQPPPCRPGLVLVGRAWAQVRTGRRRRRRHEARQVPLPDQPAGGGGWGRPVLDELAGQLSAAVTAGRISTRAAQAVYLTRVAGYSTSEAGGLLGCGPGVLRVVRSRAEQALAA